MKSDESIIEGIRLIPTKERRIKLLEEILQFHALDSDQRKAVRREYLMETGR